MLQNYELQQKNQMAINTIDFIDSQLKAIERNLRDSEIALQTFHNLIVDLGSESKQILEYFVTLDQERAALKLKRASYNYVLNFLDNNNDLGTLSLPSLSVFDDPSFSVSLFTGRE